MKDLEALNSIVNNKKVTEGQGLYRIHNFNVYVKGNGSIIIK
jgi:hypothetical protein